MRLTVELSNSARNMTHPVVTPRDVFSPGFRRFLLATVPVYTRHRAQIHQKSKLSIHEVYYRVQ